MPVVVPVLSLELVDTDVPVVEPVVPLELVETDVLVVVPILPLELVDTDVPVREPVALVAMLRLAIELVLKLDMGSATKVPLVGGGVILNVTVLEVTVPVLDVELRSPVDEETEYVVVVVESGLASDVAKEAGVLLIKEPEIVDLDCVGLLI